MLGAQWPGARWYVELGLGSGFGGLGGQWDEDTWNDGATGTAIWGTHEPEWTDVSAFLWFVSWATGRDKLTSRFNAGTATLVLDNTAGGFLTESGEPGIGDLEVRAGTPARILADWGAGKVAQWTGHIEDIMDQGAGAGFEMQATLVCLDALAAFANIDDPADAEQGGGELSGDRIHRILDRVQWGEALRDVDAGKHTMQSTTLAQPTLDLLGITADSEGGAVFVSKDGLVVFRQRDWLQEATRSTVVQASIGRIADGDDIDLVGDPTWDRAASRVRNDVQLSRVGGTVVRRQDGYSQVAIGGSRRCHRRLDLICQTDAQVEYLAEQLLGWLAPPVQRITKVDVSPRTTAEAAAALGLELGDLVAVGAETAAGWALTTDAHLVAIAGTVSGNGEWSLTFGLDPSTVEE